MSLKPVLWPAALCLLMHFTCGYNFIIATLSHNSMKQEDESGIPTYAEQIKKRRPRGLKQQPRIKQCGGMRKTSETNFCQSQVQSFSQTHHSSPSCLPCISQNKSIISMGCPISILIYSQNSFCYWSLQNTMTNVVMKGHISCAQIRHVKEQM